jgi:chromosome partitioning protein
VKQRTKGSIDEDDRDLQQKGGVGKTTISVLLADAATRAGQRVLLVDLDPQANATEATGGRGRGKTLGDVLADPGGASLAPAIRPCALQFDVATSSVELASKERNRRTADEHDLRRLLRPFAESYDLALVDSPPSLGVLTVNALTAADEYLVITDPAKFALDGIRGVNDTADVVRSYFNSNLASAGVIINLADATLETKRRLDELHRLDSLRVLDPMIPRRVVVKEAIARGRSLWDYGTDRGADDVCRAVERLVDQLLVCHAT